MMRLMSLFPAPRSPRRFVGLVAAFFLMMATSSLAQTTAAPTRTTLAVTPNGSGAGTILSATVKTAVGAPVSGGSVDFVLPGGQSLGSAVVNGEGVATLSLANAPTGNAGAPLTVSAAYTGSDEPGGFENSASVATPLATPQAGTVLPDFTVTGTPTTVTTTAGSYGSTVITVTSVGGYAGAIQFSCSNVAPSTTCSFNPTQQTVAANGTFSSTLELQTQAPSGKASASLEPLHTGLLVAMVLPGGLMLFGLRRRRGGVLLLAVVALAGLGGCSQRYGYLHHPAPVAGGTPPGTYTVTVAVDGNQGASVIEHDLTISLVVK